MVRPVSYEFEVSQEFGSFPTAGVAGNWKGSTVQQLVAQYGNYQPFGHAGQDIACPIGTPVHAIADGVVVWADWGTNLPGDDTDAGYRQRWYLYKTFPGIVTVIQHDGWLSVYGHLSNNDAAPRGTRVKEGQLIALSGNTGGVAPHLHVAAIVDTSYRTGGGLIYGCADPRPLYGSNTITLQSESITPLEAGFLMALTDEEQKRILAWADRGLYVVDRDRAKVLTNEDLPAIADAVLNRDVPWYGFDGNRPAEGRTTTTLALNTGYTDTTTIGLHGAIAALKEIVTQLSVQQGVTIDYGAIAKAVNDDAAQRMQK